MPRILRFAPVLAMVASFAFAQDLPSEESVEFFKRNCASCHTIGGGKLTGPDLKGVLDRRARDKVAQFILDPKGEIESGDPYVRRLVEEARGVVMQPIPGIDRALANKLVNLIAYESKLEKSRFAGTVISDRPLTVEDTRLGEAYFTGRTRLKNGAPACNSCHAVRDLSGLGGGILGPDLTAAYARLDGRKALAAWLAAPPSPVMQPVYKAHGLEGDEILALVSYMKDAAEKGEPEAAPASLEFVALGVLGAAALLTVMDVLWRRRFVAVRRPLVRKEGP